MTNKEVEIVNEFLAEAQKLFDKYNVCMTKTGKGVIIFNPGPQQSFKHFKDLKINKWEWDSNQYYRYQTSKLTIINDDEMKIEKKYSRDLEGY
jgi:hypothetical protein